MLSLLALAGTLAATPLPTAAPSFEYTSRYLTMRDGVRIAVDLYLPRAMAPGAKLPTVLLQTRYFRAHRVAWPASAFWPGLLEPRIARYVEQGYAFVVVDARGSGASFGTRTQEWSPDEVRDGAEIMDWIVAQPWSNGRIGATGISYDGTASEFALTNRHPALRAIVPQSGLFDAYMDTAFPGGVKLEPFLEFWSRVTAAEDANRMGEMISFFPRLVYRGVKPVQGDSGELLLSQALREHVKNYNVAREIAGFEFSDQTNQVANMSPYAKRDLTQASGAAIYSLSGWYDGALMNSAIKRFLTIQTPGSRLILGPWSHQEENLSPFATSLDDFSHTALIIRFFDRYLKDEHNGIDDEPLVRYYTIGEEQWKTAPTWPPPGTTTASMYFGEGKTLTTQSPSGANASDAYTVDFTAGSGQETRWNNLTGLDISHTITRDRAVRDKKLLVYTGAPLTSDLEITGHPLVSLHLSSTASDGAVFVYLEDVAPDGHVYPITDGQFRLACRKIATMKAPYEFPAPYRTFAKRDLEPLTPGEIAEITFDLYPISYRVRAGHSIRVSIAGADVDHFTRIPAAPASAPTLTIHRDTAHPSRVILPVMPTI